MIGYYNPTHHGYKLALIGLDERCPYPAGTGPYEEFQLGARRAKGGLTWDGDTSGGQGRRQQRKLGSRVGARF